MTMTMTDDCWPEDDDEEWAGSEKLAPLEDVYPRDDEEETQLWR